MQEIDVGNDFYFRLANRNRFQGNGQFTAEDFRKKYLFALENEEAWDNLEPYIILNFANVKKIGPSFANEAFAFFMKYTNPESFRKKVVLNNLSNVQKLIIEKELCEGYSK